MDRSSCAYVMLMLCLCRAYVMLMLCLCCAYVVLMLCLCCAYVVLMSCSCCAYVVLMSCLCCTDVMLMLCLCRSANASEITISISVRWYRGILLILRLRMLLFLCSGVLTCFLILLMLMR